MNIFKRIFTRKIHAYALIDTEKAHKFLTVTTSKLDAKEYLIALLTVLHNEHFISWCELRDFDPESVESWITYYATAIDQAEINKYKIIDVWYSHQDLLAIVRMFGHCFPIGCSFETEAEILYFESLLANAQANFQEQSESEEQSTDESE